MTMDYSLIIFAILCILGIVAIILITPFLGYVVHKYWDWADDFIDEHLR